jgi:formylglycine-generating enzyme required for sulfatase activity
MRIDLHPGPGWRRLSLAGLLLAAAAQGQEVAPPLELVYLPRGCFQMGSATGERHERPVHEVCVESFELGKFEITQAQWRSVMGGNPSRFTACGDNCPVERVSWSEVQEFIARLNAQKRGVFRLPTEAEWEYACRSGGKAEDYAGGGIADLDELAWYSKGDAGNTTHLVGAKKPNALGLHDMSGNVWEWVQDRFTSPYGAKPGDPDARIEDKRVLRGGSWDAKANDVRCAIRNRQDADRRDPRLGFRVAREIAR